MRALLLLSPLAGLALLSACGPQVNAPSLGLRPVEKQPIDLPAPASEPQTPVDPALTARLAKLVAAAQEGDRAFARERGGAEAAIAKAAGTGSGSEAWIVAQQTLTALDAARGPVREAAGLIDATRVKPAYAGSGDRAAIDAAAETVDALDEAENAAMAALSAKLGG